jgi:hypothetical protein
VEFHDTPKHASWLNMAAIEISFLSRQCLDQRMANREFLASEVAAWQKAQNKERRTIEWRFTRQDADLKLGRHYVSKLLRVEVLGLNLYTLVDQIKASSLGELA